MSRKSTAWYLAWICLLSLTLSGCFRPPYNNFQPYNPVWKHAATGAALGTIGGAVAGHTLIGTAIGLTIGTSVGLYKQTKYSIIEDLQKEHIQFIEYGDTKTLIVPTDRYYRVNTARFHELRYPGLVNIIRLIKLYPNSLFYVAGFTDNVGSRHNKNRMSQAQAETMLTFLWAHDIDAKLLNAEGYGDKFTIGDNKIIHGSAYNRRIEIQWIAAQTARPAIMQFIGVTK